MAGRPADHLEREAGGATLARRLGVRLRDRRLGLGHTLSDVAGQAGISASYLSAVEKGINLPSLPVLGRLVHALGLTLHELLREDEGVQVRSGQIAFDDDATGAQPLQHPELRLRATALLTAPGERGDAPLPVAGWSLFVFIDRGALAVEIDGVSHALGAGDALDAVDVGEVRWAHLGGTRALSVWGAARPRSRANR